MKVLVNGKMKHLIKYNPHEPETLEFWVPPAFYKDLMLEVVFDRITGAFATAGPIEIYRYEYEEGEGEAGSGAMAQEGEPVGKTFFIVSPNPFKEKTEIRWCQPPYGRTSSTSVSGQIPDGSQKISLKIYDVAGRLVKQFNHLTSYQLPIIWSGEDENGRKVTSGVYFLEFENSDTKETSCQKIIKVE